MTVADAHIAASRRLLARLRKGERIYDDEWAPVLERVTDAADWVNAGKRQKTGWAA